MSFSVWRLQTNTDSITGEKVADICLRDSVVAMGWSLKNSHLDDEKYALTSAEKENIKKLRQNITSFDDYIAIILNFNIYRDNLQKSRKVDDNIMRLYNDMTIGDLVWMRNNGQYYLGRVCEGSTWRYVANQTF